MAARGRRTPPDAGIGYLLYGPPAANGDRGEDRRAALADALGRFTPALEPDPPGGCWLDLRAGGAGPSLVALGAAILALAAEWGFPAARLGFAPTPGAARLAARHGAANPAILAPDGVVPFLAPLAIAALADDGADPETVTRLALVGLRTLGDLAALPPGALGDYLGPAGPRLEALARGADARPLVPARAPLVLTARRELDWALADWATLARMVERLLAPLLAQLGRQGLGATAVTLTLARETGVCWSRTVPLAAPTVDLAAILPTLASALPAGDDELDEGQAQGAGYTAVALALAAPRPVAGRQASFLDVAAGREGALRRGLAEARRRAPDGRLGRLVAVDPAHALPERRWRLACDRADGDAAGAPDDGGRK